MPLPARAELVEALCFKSKQLFDKLRVSGTRSEMPYEAGAAAASGTRAAFGPSD